MPVDLHRLTKGWLELESDPGLFTLLLEDFGVKGVQVEEIYDLQKLIDGPVYGFIFLFKWIEERRSRRKVVVTEECFVENEETVNSIFFAQQVVPNSCATHALLSVLLNCPRLHLGPTLTRLKDYTKNMSPENKGYAIGNTPELARAHNSHAKPQPLSMNEKSHNVSTGRTKEAFHFVSYVPIKERLFELDGLKPSPIDHGPWAEGEDWTETFRRVITERLGIATSGEPYHDVRFNLMAVVPDKRIACEQKLRTLKTNRQTVLEALQQLVKLTNPELTSADRVECIAAVDTAKSSKTTVEVLPPPAPPPTTMTSTVINPTVKLKAEPANISCAAGRVQGSCASDGGGAISSSTSMAAASSTEINSVSNVSAPSGNESPYPKLPPALASHNYAKSPMMEGIAAGDIRQRISPDKRPDEPPSPSLNSPLKPLSIDTSTSADLMKPLTIQTKFQASPTPSASSSTDTSSETGSAFNSPVRPPPVPFSASPNSKGTASGKSNESTLFEDVSEIKKFMVIRVTSAGTDRDAPTGDRTKENVSISETRKSEAELSSRNGCDNLKRQLSSDSLCSGETVPTKRASVEDSDSNTSGGQEVSRITTSKGVEAISTSTAHDLSAASVSKRGAKQLPLVEPHKFAPKDLLALLKTVENEISICENNLRDEVDKRRKYKIDDSRRTHNYDQFVCTFLSMLAEQGHLTDLVEQQLMVRKRQGIQVGRLHRTTKKPEQRKRAQAKRRK